MKNPSAIMLFVQNRVNTVGIHAIVIAALFFSGMRVFAQCGGTISGPSTVNIGASITLSASVGGGAWSVSSTDATISGGGLLTGITGSGVTVSYTVSAGCIATKPVTVNAMGGATCTSWDTVGTKNFTPTPAGFTLLKLDRNGTPYVVYVDYPAGWRCRLIKYNGAAWVDVGPGYFSPMNCNSPYLTFDTSGMPCVSFVDLDMSQKATVMRYNGSNWDTIGPRGFTPDNVQSPRISVDGSGNIYLAYSGVSSATSTSVIHTMMYDGSSWVPAGAGDNPVAPDLSSFQRLAIDGSGIPYILYYVSGTGSSVKKYNGTSWDLVGAANFFPAQAGTYQSDLAINSSGTPYVVSMSDNNNHEVLVKKFDGSSWVLVGAEVGHSSVPASPTRITIDSADNIYVSYKDVYNGDRATIKKFDGTSWNTLGHAGFSHLPIAPYSLGVRNDGVPFAQFGYSLQATVIQLGATLPAITGSGNICVGATATLSNSYSGGVWSSSNTSVASIGSGSGIATGIALGTSSISYANNSGCVVTKALTVSNLSAGSISGSPATCVGGTTTLSHASSGGTWSSSNTARVTVNATSGVVTGVTVGTAYITYSLAGGCFATVQVTVNNTFAGDISGAIYMCVGTTTTFTHAIPGGIWSSSNTSQATVDASTGIITGISAGTPTISYSIGGCFRTKNITVNAGGGGTITGTTTICVGSTSVLSAFAPGTSWTSSNPAVATIGVTSGVVTGISAGTTLISFLGTSGCGSSVVVTVLPLPTAISGTLTLCRGATTTLSSVGTTGGTWTSSATSKAIIGSASGIVTGINGGTSNITYTWTNGCKRTERVTVNPLPTPGVVQCLGSTIVHTGSAPTRKLTATGGEAGGVWTSSNAVVMAVTTTASNVCTVTALSAGAANITYTVTNGCGTTFNKLYLSVVSPRTGEQLAGAEGVTKFSVYPNPTSGALNIEAPVTGTFTIYTIDSRQVVQQAIADAVTAFRLPPILASGIYMCRFNGDDGSVVMARLVYEP